MRKMLLGLFGSCIPSKPRLDFVDLYKLQLLCKMYQSKVLLVDAIDLQT